MAAGHVKEHEQGQLAGVNAALAGFMSMIGPLWAGAVYDHVAPGSPYWMGAALLVIACLLLKQVKIKSGAITLLDQNSFTDNSQVETGD